MGIGTLEEGRLLEVNDRYVELFGYPREELIGYTADGRGIWADPGQRMDLIRRIRSGETIRNILDGRFDFALLLCGLGIGGRKRSGQRQ